MFDSEFYPTPLGVIEKMISSIGNKIYSYTILEPSAGSGSMLDAVTKLGAKKENLYAIEQNEELSHILSGKGYKVIHNDFLTYGGDYIFDLILMNPPFSNGDEHLLKAWHILEEGEIICLLNAETVLNPYSKKRQLLKSIIDQYGSFEELGDVFSDAERKTNVNIGLVRLKKKAERNRFDFFEGGNKAPEAIDFDEKVFGNQMAIANVIRNFTIYHNETKKAYVEYMKARDRLNFYAKPLGEKIMDIVKDAESWKSYYDYNKKNSKENLNKEYNTFLQGLNQMSWNAIFNKTKFNKITTSKVKTDFENYSKTQGLMDFTEENIENLFNTLFLNKGMIMERCLLETFEMMTSYDKKNKVHWEGWKTNDAYKVNIKVILPHFIKWCDIMKYFGFSYYGEEKLDDIDKVMCMLSGKQFEDKETITIRKALRVRFEELRKGIPEDWKAQSTFFDLQFFKKGTLHITFRDKYLHQEFNIRAAKGKNWLPDVK